MDHRSFISTFGSGILAPNDEYRPVIMWFWNADLDEEQIRHQIRQFKAKRIYQFFIHPAYGFEVEYLSDDYFHYIGIAVDEARRQGMRFWIYDEYAWPSGTAGGKVLRDHPEDRMRTLLHARYELAPGQSVALDPPGQFLLLKELYWNDAERTQLLRQEQSEQCPAHWINTTEHPASLIIFSEAVSGGVHPSAKWSAHSWNQEGSLDGCNPAAVRHFIQATHEQYYQRFAEDFGKTIAGVFVDEPVLSTGWLLEFPAPYGGMPWHAGMREGFRQSAGYDLLDRGEELVYPVGQYRKTRCDYWRYLARQFSDSLSGQLHEWSNQHKIGLTGHLNAEENLMIAMLTSGDWYESIKRFDVPGVDHVLSRQQLNTEEMILPAKQVSSVANQLGRPRIMCETFTGSGWNMTLLEMKRIADQLCLLGINMIQYMGAYYSVKGFRKLPPDASWPPAHDFHNALWPGYEGLSDYLADTCRLNSWGTHAASVAVLFPMTSVWASYRFGHDQLVQESPSYAQTLENQLQTYLRLSRSLLELQTDFEYVFEETLSEATIEEGMINIGGLTFSTLILPACSVVHERCWSAIERFVRSGGRLIAVNGQPQVTAEGSSLAEAFEQLQKQSEFLSCISVAWDRPNIKETFCKTLADHLPSNARVRLTPSSPDVWVQLRKNDGHTQVCLLNVGSASFEGTIEHLPTGCISVFRPGPHPSEWEKAQDISMTRDGQQMHLTLAPYEMLFVRWESATAPSKPLTTSQNQSKPWALTRVELTTDWTMTPASHGNLFPLHLRGFEETNSPVSLEQACALPLNAFKDSPDQRFLEHHPWVMTSGTGWGRMEGDCPLSSFGAGQHWWVRADFDLEFIPDNLRLITENLGLSQIAVNGKPLMTKPCHVWDQTNIGADLTGVVQSGLNTLLMQLAIPQWSGPHALPMAALQGSFEVGKQGMLIRPRSRYKIGDWCKQGYPYYSGTMCYEATFVWEQPLPTQAWLCVQDVAHLAQLTVNGHSAGMQLWPPYRFPIGAMLKNGENKIQLNISNTSANLFRSKLDDAPTCLTGPVPDMRRYEPMPSGILGPVYIEASQA